MKQKFREMQTNMQDQMNQQQDFTANPQCGRETVAQKHQRKTILILKRSNKQDHDKNYRLLRVGGNYFIPYFCRPISFFISKFFLNGPLAQLVRAPDS